MACSGWIGKRGGGGSAPCTCIYIVEIIQYKVSIEKHLYGHANLGVWPGQTSKSGSIYITFLSGEACHNDTPKPISSNTIKKKTKKQKTTLKNAYI